MCTGLEVSSRHTKEGRWGQEEREEAEKGEEEEEKKKSTYKLLVW